MKPFRLSLRFPRGGVRIGGYSAVPVGFSATHATDKSGLPLIPATALRGALRETLEALLRGNHQPACSGGDGVDPTAAVAKESPPVCLLDNGKPCKACRLFGTQRGALSAGERAFSAVVLGDARLPAGLDDIAPRWTRLPGVSIGRQQRSAKENRLYLQRVPAVRQYTFSAEGRLIDAALDTYLRAAVENTKYLGGGRSRGLGRVEIELTWLPEPVATRGAQITPARDLYVRFTLKSPAFIGTPVTSEQMGESRSEIPGSVLRGAVGFALAETLDDPDGNTAFQALVNAGHGAHFGFLHMVEPGAQGAGGLPGPWPITAAACKKDPFGHGVVDTLLDRIAAELVTDGSQARAVEKHQLHLCGSAGCDNPLKGAPGERRHRSSLRKRLITRVALERTTGSAKEQALFSRLLLEEGAVFEGSIRNIPASGFEHLRRALGQPLSLGRGRAMGWGQVTTELRPLPAQSALTERGAEFDRLLQAHLVKCSLPVELVGRLVPITFLSPFIPPQDDEDGSRLFGRLLSGGELFLRARRFQREGGWDASPQRGNMSPVVAIAAGAVYVLDVGPGKSWRDAVVQLERIERDGLGERRHQGYGHAICFDPFIGQRTFKG